METDDTTTEPDGGQQGDDSGQAPQQQPEQTVDGDESALPPWAQKALRDARAEAGKSRTQAKANAANEARQQLAQDIGKALGLFDDDADEPPTPEQLTEQLRESRGQLTSAQEQAVAAAIELSVYRTAAGLGANADRLLDSRAFCDEIDSIDVDPADREAFATAVKERITAALDRDPSLRAQSAGRSGGDMSAGTGDQPPSLEKRIAEAQAAGDTRLVLALKTQQLRQIPLT